MKIKIELPKDVLNLEPLQKAMLLTEIAKGIGLEADIKGADVGTDDEPQFPLQEELENLILSEQQEDVWDAYDELCELLELTPEIFTDEPSVKSILYDEAYPKEASNMFMWRGIGDSEYDFIKRNGYVKSKGSGNAEDEDGLTFYAPTFRQAENYARSAYELYGANKAYVICILRDDSEFGIFETEAGELATKAKIPISYITDHVHIPESTSEPSAAMDDGNYIARKKDFAQSSENPETLEKSWLEGLHPRDKQGRFTTKWGRAVHIANNIDTIRRQYEKDLKKKGMPRDKAVALMVGLIDKGAFRIGNDESAEERGVFGLTTLKREHIRVHGDVIHFDFIGKKGVHQQHSVQDPLLAKTMSQMLKIEGGMRSGGKVAADDAVFKYENTQGQIRTPSQYVINNYLDKWGVTAKDFRTYHASSMVEAELKKLHKVGKTETARKKDIKRATELAAKRLGHQPDTCKRNYIDPSILERYMAGDIEKSFEPDLYKAKGGKDDWKNKFMEEIGHIIDRYVKPAGTASKMALRGLLLGKVIEQAESDNLDLAKLAIETMPVKVQPADVPYKLRAKDKGDFMVLPLQQQEVTGLEYATLRAGEYLRNATEDLKSGVRQTVMQAMQERWEAGELASALYDRFGEYNRDWRRIAITELAYCMNNGYLGGLKDGDVVTIQEAEDCCKHCREVNLGKMLTVRKQAGDGDSEVWVGKTNVGRKAKEYQACVPLHPHCRGRYVKFNSTFYKLDEHGNKVLKKPEEILAERKGGLH